MSHEPVGHLNRSKDNIHESEKKGIVDDCRAHWYDFEKIDLWCVVLIAIQFKK